MTKRMSMWSVRLKEGQCDKANINVVSKAEGRTM